MGTFRWHASRLLTEPLVAASRHVLTNSGFGRADCARMTRLPEAIRILAVKNAQTAEAEPKGTPSPVRGDAPSGFRFTCVCLSHGLCVRRKRASSDPTTGARLEGRRAEVRRQGGSRDPIMAALRYQQFKVGVSERNSTGIPGRGPHISPMNQECSAMYFFAVARLSAYFAG